MRSPWSGENPNPTTSPYKRRAGEGTATQENTVKNRGGDGSDTSTGQNAKECKEPREVKTEAWEGARRGKLPC